MKVALIGSYPPPLGGISVHIKRIKMFMDKKGFVTNVYTDTFDDKQNRIFRYTYKKIILKLFFSNEDILHFHIIDKRIRMLIHTYKIFNKKVILTVHGESLKEQFESSSKLTKFFFKRGLNKIDKIICVNPESINYLKSLGIKHEKLDHISAYINPIECDYDYKLIPKEVYKFINKSKFIISANGAIRFNENQDLYGLDMLIELIKKMKSNNKDVSLLFCVLSIENQNISEKQYYLNIKNKIKEYNLEEKIFLYEVYNTEFYPILQKSNLFIRPTNTDGYGVSVAEAIYYNVPAIASDVCKRPKGTILFKSRDFEDLYMKVNYVIANFEKEKEKLKSIKVKDNSEKILKIYRNLLVDGEE